MNRPFLVSYAMLWLLVVLQSGLLFVLLREIGKTYLSSSSSFQRDGLAVGRRIPPLTVQTRRGLSRVESFFGSEFTIVLVASDGCSVCGPVADIVRRWSERTSDFGAVVLLNAPRLGAWADIGLDVVLVDPEDVKRKLEVRATPFVFVTDPNGQVMSKGLINTHAHLNALLKEALGKSRSPARPTEPQMVALAGSER